MQALFFTILAACRGGGGDSVHIDGDQCQSCHGGIEAMHGPPMEPGDCVSCHGGNPNTRVKDEAHVPVPSDYADIRGTGLPDAPYGFIEDMAPDQLDQLDPAYVKFINPTDIRVVGETCGGCHADKVETMPNSVMTTNAAHYWPTRFLAGLQGREAIYGSFPASDPDWDGTEGTQQSLQTLVPPPDAEWDDTIDAGDLEALEDLAYTHYLAKSCNTCHQAGYNPADAPHLYRSTGCASCHVLYNEDGVYNGDDPTISRGIPKHPDKHQLTTAIPTEQCATCHFQGGRIGLNFRGIRESNFSMDADAIADGTMEVWQENAYNHAVGYYVLDEDTTNDYDETPPDIHYEKGMHCADCHVGTDVHGDGRIYDSSKGQVDIRCEDCHGTVRQRVTPDAAGVYRTQSGRELPQLSTNTDGDVVLTGRVDGELHTVPQPAELLAPGGDGSVGMHEAMAPDAKGWSHTDSLTCDTCHTSWQLFCLDCHVSVDLALSQTDMQTGLSSKGRIKGGRSLYTLDDVLLAQGVDGRAQSTVPSQAVQMAVIHSEVDVEDSQIWIGEFATDKDGKRTGKTVGKFRETKKSFANNGFAPFFQHTVTNRPRGCDTCHRTGDSKEEWARVRGVYGYGTGEFMLTGPDDQQVDALQFLDEKGNLTVEFHHPGTGPLSQEVINKALAVEVP